MPKQEYIESINAYLPDVLKRDIDILIDDVLNDSMDMLIVIDGKEGAGKSYDARLIAKYISSVVGTPFGVNNIHFTTQSYINFSEKKPKFTINVLDEGREALNRKRGMSKSNVLFSNWISENRDKQQFHIILLPAIHDLESYVSTWRMKLLIHKLVGHQYTNKTRSGYEMVRGYFKVYENGKNLQSVIHNKQKYGYYAYPRECKYKRKIKFAEVFNADELKQYSEKKKRERTKKYSQDETNPDYKFLALVNNLKEMLGLTHEQIAPLVGKKRSSVGNMIKEFRGYADTNQKDIYLDNESSEQSCDN